MESSSEAPAPAIRAGDPYPDLPWIAPAALRDGDVLMMLGRGVAWMHGLPVPVSWIIRALDGGAYSHAAMVSVRDGAPRVWDHSDDWSLHPVPLDQGIRRHRWCHVYRFRKHGDPLGSTRYPRPPVVRVLDAHEGDPYDVQLLVFAGVVAVVSRMPERAWLRRALRVALGAVVWLLEWLLDRRDIREGALVCTGVAGLSFWDARQDVPHDYALEVDLERRRGARAADPAWRALVARIEAVLARIWEDFPERIATYRRTVEARNASWVEVGSPGLPVNLVAPSDLEFSRTLERVGRLAIPADGPR